MRVTLSSGSLRVTGIVDCVLDGKVLVNNHNAVDDLLGRQQPRLLGGAQTAQGEEKKCTDALP